MRLSRVAKHGGRSLIRLVAEVMTPRAVRVLNMLYVLEWLRESWPGSRRMSNIAQVGRRRRSLKAVALRFGDDVIWLWPFVAKVESRPPAGAG